jgi:hypothetical protein
LVSRAVKRRWRRLLARCVRQHFLGYEPEMVEIGEIEHLKVEAFRA